MIRISILTLTALCFSLTTQADNHGFDNFIEVELTVSTITMNDSGMVITYEGMAGKYGLVHATHNMVSTNDANAKGYFTGTVQAIDDTGALESSMTLGLWSRDGTQLKVYGFDDDSPTRILHISTVDLRAKTFQAKVWELD
jgi:hypothetical protein